MGLSLTTQPAKAQNSIVNQIIDGSITIDSIGEFQSMLKIFPGNPYLHRALADLLVRRKSFSTAAEYFGLTAMLFIEAGHVLQAVVAKMLQWQIVKPSFRSIKEFYHSLLENNPRATPLNMFFAGLSFREFVALVTRMERIVLPAGKMVKKFGDPENNLYMVVSGQLHRRTYPSVRQSQSSAPIVENIEGDIFGEVFPLETEHFSQSYIETVTRVELLKITRQKLIEVGGDFPSVAVAIGDLFTQHDEMPPPYVIRKNQRHAIPVRVTLEIAGNDGAAPLSKLSGHVRDLSISGACILLDETADEGSTLQWVGKTVLVIMSSPRDALAINVKGTVVWSKMMPIPNGSTRALGIQFRGMSPNLSGLLLVFADNLCHAQ